MDPTNPSAEVRPAASLAEMVGEVRLMWNDHVRTSLEQARDIGNKLRAIKAECVRQSKPWLPVLGELHLSRVTAWKYMRIAEKWSLLVDFVSLGKQGGVNEAIKWLAGGEGEEDEIHAHKPPKGGAAGMAPAPLRPAKLCERCSRKGYQVGCEACKELNEGRGKPQPAKPATPAPTEDKPREPGEDDGEVDAAQEKYDASRLDKAMRSGPLLRELRELGRVHRLTVPEAKKPWEPSEKGWWKQFDPILQGPLKKWWDARTALLGVMKKLEGGGQ